MRVTHQSIQATVLHHELHVRLDAIINLAIWNFDVSFITSTGEKIATLASPVSAFFHNLDDPTAPPAGTLAYVGRLLGVRAATAVVHLGNRGGHGFGLCQGRAEYLEVCDWPKQAQRFLQDHGLAPGWPEGAPTEAEMLQQNCAAEAKYE